MGVSLTVCVCGGGAGLGCVVKPKALESNQLDLASY